MTTWNVRCREGVRCPCATLGQERSKKSWQLKTPSEMARLEHEDHFVDPSVNAFHGEVSVNEDRFGAGEWRVEYFDDDGGCYVTIFAGPAAARRARDYFTSLKSGRLSIQREPSHSSVLECQISPVVAMRNGMSGSVCARTTSL